MPDARRPAALLLTGGASRRLGQDKATLPVGGKPLAERTAALLIEVADPVVEVGPGYTGLVRAQEEPAGAGPLAAMAAGWACLAAGAVSGAAPWAALVVATDLPRLTHGLLELLARHPASGCVIPVDEAGRSQHLCARYPAATLARAEGLVRHGQRAVRALLEGQAVISLPPAIWLAAAGRPDALADIDTLDDLMRLVGPVDAGGAGV